MQYLHGASNIIPGLERELEGKSVGDHLQVTIPPADAYGEINKELVQVISRDHFKDLDVELEVGMKFQTPTENENEFMIVTIAELTDDGVTVDGNHELAGLTLHFDVTVRDIRDATGEEIAHGHAHGPGGHHH